MRTFLIKWTPRERKSADFSSCFCLKRSSPAPSQCAHLQILESPLRPPAWQARDTGHLCEKASVREAKGKAPQTEPAGKLVLIS